MKYFFMVLLVFFLAGVLAWASDEAPVITIKDHRFSPEALKIPADKKIKLIVKNEDASAEEFESYELRREKVVSGHDQITLYLGPLKAGRYPYFGDFHQESAKGVIIAAPAEEKGS